MPVFLFSRGGREIVGSVLYMFRKVEEKKKKIYTVRSRDFFLILNHLSKLILSQSGQMPPSTHNSCYCVLTSHSKHKCSHELPY
jgi:hypothetical protein